MPLTFWSWFACISSSSMLFIPSDLNVSSSNSEPYGCRAWSTPSSCLWRTNKTLVRLYVLLFSQIKLLVYHCRRSRLTSFSRSSAGLKCNFSNSRYTSPKTDSALCRFSALPSFKVALAAM
ncbi:hypothetical protein M440DRAFT_357766 [Trichoderma longibrachiatum ATCC 18648]|uniref:Uncharacterized protein n=1 Tax=Trichoderma longibrachiatum ATCC 18648 TaxID=983965 RepID=A0A2T4CJH2_TRILO|nr:hypothetical protein M440DRAFT_357766 [Trichoderma longibrachiatum ATCC 18648]